MDLRQRREAVVLALRRLGGSNAAGLDGEWGDDLAAYGDLLDGIEQHSAPELNVYLREESLTPILDGLIGSVSRQDPETLRQLAATAPVEIARIQRLLDVMAARLRARSNISPGLTAFTDSLRLFVDAFDQNRTGARLIDLSVPLPLAAQQLNEGDAEGRRALLELVIGRGQYAREVDCFLSCCGGTTAELTTQAKLDMFQSHLDRAVDLYSLGSSANGLEERRASVYKLIAEALNKDPEVKRLTNLSNILTKLAATLDSGRTPTPPTPETTEEVLEELCAEESDWEALVRSLVPNCVAPGGLDPFTATKDLLKRLMSSSTKKSYGHTSDFPRPDNPRISLQRIADCTCAGSSTGGSYGTPPTTPASVAAVPARLAPPPRPTEITKFFRQLGGCKDEVDLYNNASKARRQDQWKM